MAKIILSNQTTPPTPPTGVTTIWVDSATKKAYQIDDAGLITVLVSDTWKVDDSGAVTSVAINNGASAYQVSDVVTITGGDSGATFNVDAVSNGGLTAVNSIDVPGSGYAAGDTLTVDGGSSDGQVSVTSVNGSVVGATANSDGLLYSMGDQPTISGGNSDAIVNVDSVGGGGNVTAVSIVSPGSGYANGTYSLTGFGDGMATVAITIDGGITGLSIVTAGNNYSSGATTLSGGSGGGGQATFTANAIGGITAITLLTGGTGYSTSTGVATTGGSDSNNATVDVTVLANHIIPVPASPFIGIPNMPTSATGLPAGSLWNNGGAVNIV